MAKKEAATDLWVYDMLVQADIKLEPQGSSIKELHEALKTASKRGTGKSGYPEYCGVVKDFIILKVGQRAGQKAELRAEQKDWQKGFCSFERVAYCGFKVGQHRVFPGGSL